MNRRQFLASTAASAASLSMSVKWASASTTVERPLVIVFLRGGLDVLNFMAPADDKNYIASRPPALRVATTGVDKGIKIGGMDGTGDLLLNANAAPLATLWKDKRLSFIPAAGLNNATRSHFQAMDLMERGIVADGASTPRDGWLTRAALAMGQQTPGSIISMGGAMPQSLSLCEDALSVSDVWDIEWMPSQNFREALFELHAGDSMLDQSSRMVIDATANLALKLSRNQDKQPILRDPPKGITYPDHDFGRQLHFLSELLYIDRSIHVATADLGGWDTHEAQADDYGQLVATLSQSLEAFANHMARQGRPVTVVVMSEFGRRVKANESRGTDHGHGGLMMVLGDEVKGGQVLGRWPGLATEQLDQGMDLAVTTDFRDVLATVLAHHGPEGAISAAFPGHKPEMIKQLFQA